jgi:hypothetical protein
VRTTATASCGGEKSGSEFSIWRGLLAPRCRCVKGALRDCFARQVDPKKSVWGRNVPGSADIERGESVELPRAKPPALGNPLGDDYGWILGQFALLGRTDVVNALLDAGMHVDMRGWSNFTRLDQAAMHGRTETVRPLIERGGDLDDRAFDADGPTPLDCAVWGARNNRADVGDYASTVDALLAAGAPMRHAPPTGDAAVDALLIAAQTSSGPK